MRPAPSTPPMISSRNAPTCRRGIWPRNMGWPRCVHVLQCMAKKHNTGRRLLPASSNRRGHSDNYRPLHTCQGGYVACLFLARTSLGMPCLEVSCLFPVCMLDVGSAPSPGHDAGPEAVLTLGPIPLLPLRQPVLLTLRHQMNQCIGGSRPQNSGRGEASSWRPHLQEEAKYMAA
ncbi:hypothetical protein LY78DRAFT_22136 [Colletotrichum sublineola]|nr:hypothetical protein LY78DRAFT_22136 [Colletotrichum sublineola]